VPRPATQGTVASYELPEEARQFIGFSEVVVVFMTSHIVPKLLLVGGFWFRIVSLMLRCY
jgi:hypothetical protein